MRSHLTVQLNSSHDRDSFFCGKALLDHYLQRQASQDVKRNLAAVYVFVGDDSPSVIRGYYTLSSMSIPKEFAPEEMQRRMPKSYRHLPCILLGRLAIATAFGKKGFGGLLLADALLRSYNTSKTLGSIAVVVDPLDEVSRTFYEKYNFVKLAYENKMFLAMNTIRQLYEV